MGILVLFASSYGNTEAVARAVAAALGERAQVEVRSVSDAAPIEPATLDLLVVGGPTQRHGASPPLVEWLRGLPPGSLAGLPAAVFDTRYRMARLLSGAAGDAAARWLTRAGCRLVAPPASFFVARDTPAADAPRRHELESLEPGELERAAAWARGLPLGR